MTPYNYRVRRVITIIVCMSFTLCLHASVPKANSAPGLKHAADVPVEQSATHGRTALALTAGPADTTFYEEFYPSDELRVDSQTKPGHAALVH